MNQFSLRTAIVALVMSPLAAHAQAIDCQIGVEGVWIAGDQASSNVVSFMNDAPVDLDISTPENGAHVALFEVEGTDNIRIEAVGINDSDPLIEIRNESGLRIAEDDDSGGNGNARIETVLEPGIYCIATSGYDGVAIDATVRVGVTAQEALTGDVPDELSSSEPQCNANTSAEWLADGPVDNLISAGLNITGNGSDNRYFKFTLGSDTAISLLAENEDADPVLYLFDSYGDILDSNDDFDGLNSRIDLSAPLPAGDYCIGLDALSDTFAPIEVSLIEYDEAAIMGAMYDRAEASPPLDGSYPVEYIGPLTGRQRVDVALSGATKWYAIDVDASGLLVLEGIAVGDSDPLLVLFDDVGREISRNDDAGGTYDSLIASKLFPGTYLIGVTLAGGAGNGNVRLVMERYVPAQ